MKKEILVKEEEQKHVKEQTFTAWKDMKSCIKNLEIEREKTSQAAIKA